MIQPLDIKSQSFKKGLFGYKASEVDSYVNTVYKAYDELFTENENLKKKLNGTESSLQECRLKIFDLENQVNKMENVSSYEDEDSEFKKKADQIIKNAESAAAQIIAKAKEQAKKFEGTVKEAFNGDSKDTVKQKPDEGKPDVDIKESASSRFFKKTEDTAVTQSQDDDEIFVGEIEDARKPDRMMIGDGEEEEDSDFEFL